MLLGVRAEGADASSMAPDQALRLEERIPRLVLAS